MRKRRIPKNTKAKGQAITLRERATGLTEEGRYGKASVGRPDEACNALLQFYGSCCCCCRASSALRWFRPGGPNKRAMLGQH